MQGRVPASDYESGRAAQGYTCNTALVGSYSLPPNPGSHFNVWRYVDKAGNECAFFDTSNQIPVDASHQGGVHVLDMSNSSRPTLTASLQTPAMMSPHESLILNQERGLLMAVLGNSAVYPGLIDIYDVSEDCRRPTLMSSKLGGLLGHESGVSPDGLTFYTGSALASTLAAVDVSDPANPKLLTAYPLNAHGISISDDGKTAYVAAITPGGSRLPGAPPTHGIVILDVSEVQARSPVPVIREISRLFWEGMAAPQFAAPFTADGKPYLFVVDEFGSATFENVPAARIIDIADPSKPRIISDVRLEVHQAEHASTFSSDPGARGLPGYSAHFCNVSRRENPKIAACSMGISELRVFNIENPYAPREVAYFIPPSEVRHAGTATQTVSKPTFAPERREIWYTNNQAFYAVKLTNGAWPED